MELRWRRIRDGWRKKISRTFPFVELIFQSLMHKCPHCNTNSVASPAVRGSSREYPATCSYCGKLSHALSSTSNGIRFGCFLLLCAALTAAFMASSWWLAATGACAAMAFNAWAWQRVELFPISSESAKTAARASWWVIALSIFAEFFF